MTEVSHWIVRHHVVNAVFAHIPAHARWRPNVATYLIAVGSHASIPQIFIAVADHAPTPRDILNVKVRALTTFVGTALVLIPDSILLPQDDHQMLRKKLL